MNHGQAARLAESAELLAVRIGQWEDLEYPETSLHSASETLTRSGPVTPRSTRST